MRYRLLAAWRSGPNKNPRITTLRCFLFVFVFAKESFELWIERSVWPTSGLVLIG
jgi:hypothetical protein